MTGTRSILPEMPEYNSEKSTSGDIYIVEINDQRTFEQKPKSPSTPSVNGDLSATSKEQLASLIGRQRNGYGMAMGDVALAEGSNVQEQVRALLTTGLESRGYTVVDDKNAPNKVTVDIEKFWAWFSPGVFAVSFESDLQCHIDFVSPTNNTRVDVKGYGINKGQVASDANWKLAYQRAYLNFLQNLDKALDDQGL